jgi:hypothetical protein
MAHVITLGDLEQLAPGTRVYFPLDRGLTNGA